MDERVPDFRLYDDGTLLGPALLDRLLRVTVDEPVLGAALATVQFEDVDGGLSDGKVLPIGHELKVEAGYVGGPKTVIFEGEVTAWRGKFAQGRNATLTVVAMDRFHRLRRGRRQSTWLGQLDSQVVQAVAQRAGLTAKVVATPFVQDSIQQWNQSDADFVLERAGLFGYEAFVEGKVLHFRPPALQGGPVATLKWRDTLHGFRMASSLSGQVGAVEARAWRMAEKKPILAQAKGGAERDLLGGSQTGAKLVKPFQDPLPRPAVTLPATSAAEVEAYAKGEFQERSEVLAEGQGTSPGDPAIRRGTVLELEGIGGKLSGRYYVVQAVHALVPGGAYTTTFTVRRTALA